MSRLAFVAGLGILLVAVSPLTVTAQVAAPTADPNGLVQIAPGQMIDPQALCAVSNATSATIAATLTAPADPNPPAKLIKVVTTVAPLTNIAFNIGGDRIQLHGLIPEGVDSHTYEPKPSDATYLAAADLVFVNGLHLEDPTVRLANNTMRSGAILTELGGATITEKQWRFDFSFPKDRGDPNPHLWVNPLYALRYAQIFRDVFTQADPAGSSYYAANYAIFNSRVLTLDNAICTAIASIPANARKLLTYHDSFAYFSPRYGIDVIGAIQPADFSEPSAEDVIKLIDQIKREHVPAIFGSEVFPSKVLAQIGQEANVSYINTLADDDLPNQTGDRRYHSYLQLLVNDVNTLTTALGGSADSLKAVDTSNIEGSDAVIENPWP